MTTSVSKKRCCSFMIYSFKILGDTIKQLCASKKNSSNSLFHKEKLTKTSTYGFYLYKNSIFLQAYLESLGTLILVVSAFVIFILEAKSRRDLRTTYSNITTLQSQTQTASILSQIESKYSDLNIYGNDWFIRFRALVIINSMMICLFIQDCLQYLSYIVRKISTSALSINLSVAIVIDFVHTVGAIYLIIEYCTYYNISRTLSRSEEKYYKMFASTEDRGVQPKVIFAYLVIVLVYRLLYQMIYFQTFGALVQIIIKMVGSCLKFLMLSFIFLVAFTILGHILFNDINEFQSIFWSFNTMYQSVFGGFDFAIYANSTITPEYYGRIFMCLYLLGFAVLIMNFLIAILSEVYSNYIEVANALQKREIIKIRAIYENHKYYGCLVRAPIFINFYMIILAPLVVILKSERLNNLIILIQFLTTVFFFETFFMINMTIFFPIIMTILVFIKIGYISSKSKGVLDAVLRIIDVFVMIILSPIFSFLLYSAALISETHLLFKSNLIQIVGIYVKQYRYANNVMDGSINQKKEVIDAVDQQRTYFKFKRFVNPLRSKQVKYNPTNCMLSEVFASLMIAGMKIIKRNVQMAVNDGVIDDSIPLFIPTEYVIEEFQKVVCLREQFRSLVFGSTYSKYVNIDSPQLKYLISTLADKTTGGLEFDSDKPEDLESIKDDGNNLITLTATLSNHEQRVQFWRNKIFKLFTESNNQWVIDQFQICKVFLYLNSYETSINEVNEDIWEANEKLQSMHMKYQKRDNKHYEVTKRDGEKWRSSKVEDNTPTQEENLKIHLIDIPTFIGPIIGFESKIRDIIRKETENGKIPVSHQLIKDCKDMNRVAITRFVSSCMSTCYNACNTYSEK